MTLSMEFSTMWDIEVKPIALKCIEGRQELMEESKRIESMPEGEERQIAVENVNEKFGDIYGIEVISGFIWAMEHDLADGRLGLNGLNQLMMVKGCLAPDNESYWNNVWKNDFSSERAQNFRKLGELAAKLIAIQ